MESFSIYACQVISAVLESNSFTKAGKILNLTPSAVSHTVKKIENTVGYPLFHRYKKGVFMTEDGMRLIPYIQGVLQASQTLESEISKINNADYDIVKVGTFYSAAMYWMPEILKNFQLMYPNITVQLYQSGDSQIIEWIDNHNIDIAILSTDTFDTTVPFTPLYQSPLVCLTPRDFIPQNKKYIQPKDLEGRSIILQYEGFDTEISAYIKNNALSSQTNIWVESDNVGFSMVRAGLGCYLSPEMAIGNGNLDLKMYPLKPLTYRNIGILAVSQNQMSSSTKSLHDYIIQWVSNWSTKML